MIAEPAVAVRNIAIFRIHLKPVNLPEEKNRKHQMRKLVGKLHQPAEIIPEARHKEYSKENYETDEKIVVKINPPTGYCFQLECPDKDSNCNDKKHAKQSTG